MKKLLLLVLLLGIFSCSGEESNSESKLSLKNVELACIRINSCNLDMDTGSCIQYHMSIANIEENSFYDMSYDISKLREGIENKIDCLNTIKSCEEIDKCIGIERKEVQSCSDKVYCEDNVIISCLDNIQTKQDCTFLNKECVKVGGEYNSKWTCVTPNKVSNKEECSYSDNEYEASCVDEKTIKHCSERNVVAEENCEDIVGVGSTCALKNGRYRCIENKNEAEGCNEDNYGKQCDGSFVKYCGKNDTVQKIDCKKIKGENFVCDEVAYTLYENCIYKDVKLCEENKVKCENDNLIYCINNIEKKFNCKENGYSSCEDGMCKE